jgi:hypothetical protein
MFPIRRVDEVIARSVLKENTRMWHGFTEYDDSEILWDLPPDQLIGVRIVDNE